MAGREMEGKAGLHPGGRAGGPRAPGAGGGNPSPLVCGAGGRVGGADPRVLLGGLRGLPGASQGAPGGPPRDALSARALTPPPGGLAPAPGPAPRALPPTPGPDVQLAEASAGGGVLRPQPALLPCQQLHCVREERAAAESGRASSSPSAAGRASAPGRVRGGARGCAPPASRQLCSARRAVRAVPPPPPPPPLPPGPRRLPSQAGVRSGQGSPPGDRGIPVQPRGVQPAGGATCAAAPALSTAWAGRVVGLRGAPKAGCPDRSGEPQSRGALGASAPQPHRTLRSSPAYPTSAQTFLTLSPVGVAESTEPSAGFPPRGTLATLTSCLS